MKKLILHIKHWYKWQKHCLNPWYHKLFVLLGIVYSPTFWFVDLEETK